MGLVLQSRHLSKILLLIIVFFVASSTYAFSEDCPKNNLKARLDYKSGVFWSGRGDYQKAFDLFSNALEICPDYSDAIEKRNEVGLVLEEQREKERRLEAQREDQERQRYQQHLQKEKGKEHFVKQGKERSKSKLNRQMLFFLDLLRMFLFTSILIL